MATSESKLTTLLPTVPYTLAYTLPLLLVSTLLVFAATFLTLDRTRSFRPRKGTEYMTVDALFEVKPRKRTFRWYLEGGVGGLAVGYTFGVHISTLLALLIPATTSSASLSAPAFLPVWILSSIPTTVLAGRYRLAALLFAGIEGGILISLGLSVILHPSHLARLILLGICTILSTSTLLLASCTPRILHPALRACTAATGAAGMVMAIALLARPRVEGWADVWERLWVRGGGEKWGGAREKAVSAAWALFWALGSLSDWALRRYFGECPDEKWDDYLTRYVADLQPNHPNRAGTFRPLESVWERVFAGRRRKEDNYDLFDQVKRRQGKQDILFPSDKDMAMGGGPFVDQGQGLPLTRQSSITKVGFGDGEEVGVPPTTTVLKKSRSQKSFGKGARGFGFKKKRKPVKFGAIEEMSSDEEEEVARRPWILSNVNQQPSYASSTPTLVSGAGSGIKDNDNDKDKEKGAGEETVEVDYDKEIEELRRVRGREIVEHEYSDREGEGDLGMQRRPMDGREASERWEPGFLKRYRDESTRMRTGTGTGMEDGPGVIPVPGALPIPATPSLIRAVDRIQAAQREVYGESPIIAGFPGAPFRGGLGEDERGSRERGGGAGVGSRVRKWVEGPEGGGGEAGGPPRWEEFWKEVRVKARES